ncbi:MAG: phosphoglucosamine mutase [Desertimonas sp.]
MKFGTDGVRGVANSDLTAAFALRLGRAAARVLGGREAVIGGDTRRSTPMLAAAFAAGMAAEGVDVHQLGVVPTPAVAFVAAERGIAGAVVSASHNPFHDNGIKLFARGGTKLPDELEARIESELDVLPPPGGEPGELRHGLDAAGYVAHLVGALEGRHLDGLRVVVDAANGAAVPVAAEVFANAGADITVIHDRPDGRNINAGCGATAPASLAAAVVARRADLGLALDGDADRLIAVDHTGAVVDGDHIIALCALDLCERGELVDDTVVVTVMTNLGFRLAMERAGISVVETAVGDRYVLEALDRDGLVLGGEQSGHVIFRRLATTGDGLLTGLALCDLVRRAGRPLAELAEGAMTRLPQVLINVPVRERMPDAAQRFAAEVAELEPRLGATGRVLLRASGTEPLVRVMVEAESDAVAHDVAEDLAALVRRAVGA